MQQYVKICKETRVDIMDDKFVAVTWWKKNTENRDWSWCSDYIICDIFVAAIWQERRPRMGFDPDQFTS